MADLVQTAANVLASGSFRSAICGSVAIVAGNTVYVAAGNTVELCENDQTAVEAACVDIAVNNASPGQPIQYSVGGSMDVGATLVIGEVYCVGAAPGSIAPTADITTGEFQTVLGIATAADALKVSISAAGVASA